MVDLDSDPTKLIEIVEIGKQLLITRGALTTFSIANDIAKYFAIIPALFVALFPGLDLLNVMRLHSPQSAILSAVIFNAIVIVALIPLSLRGVRYTPEQRVEAVEPQPLRLRPRRHHRPVHRHQAHRPRQSNSSPGCPEHEALQPHSSALGRAARAAGAHRRSSASPTRWSVWLVAQLPGLNDKADGSIVQADGKPVGSSLIGQLVHRRRRQPAAAVLPEPAVGGRRRLRPDGHQREQPRTGEHRRRRPTSRACSPWCARAARRSASSTASTARGRSAPATASAPCCR